MCSFPSQVIALSWDLSCPARLALAGEEFWSLVIKMFTDQSCLPGIQSLLAEESDFAGKGDFV